MSLKMCSIASGSKGNCCYVSDGENDILIDLGISCARVEKCLAALGVNPDRVSIYVTHSHSDHICGLKVFCKKHPEVKVYCQKESEREVAAVLERDPIVVGTRSAVGNIHVRAVPVSHDVPCFGYVLSRDGSSVAVVTDVGELNRNTLELLCGCGIVMLEANHDPMRLRTNPHYSPSLKARIASACGHLSNADCAAACAFLANNGVRHFILAHLSEDNNDPMLAVSEVTDCIEHSGVFGTHVVAATQNSMTGLFEIC